MDTLTDEVDGLGTWMPDELPIDDEDELQAIADRMLAEGGPRGHVHLVRAIRSFKLRKQLYDSGRQEVQAAWKFVRGVTSPRRLKAAKVKSVRSRAAKFYATLSASSLRQHCAMYGLDYDAYEDVDTRIDALAAKAAESL